MAPSKTLNEPKTPCADDRVLLQPAPPGEHPLIEFRPSSIHGLGGFARVDVAEGTRVIEYLGERITKQESLRRCQDDNVFIFTVNNEFDLDGSVEWNPARLLNHSCSPNCEAQCVDDRIWIVAVRLIRAGEEVTFDYGYDLEHYGDHPCHCGARDCLRYIVSSEFSDLVRRKNSWKND
jgi:SET domain-containing protein